MRNSNRKRIFPARKYEVKYNYYNATDVSIEQSGNNVTFSKDITVTIRYTRSNGYEALL